MKIIWDPNKKPIKFIQWLYPQFVSENHTVPWWSQRSLYSYVSCGIEIGSRTQNSIQSPNYLQASCWPFYFLLLGVLELFAFYFLYPLFFPIHVSNFRLQVQRMPRIIMQKLYYLLASAPTTALFFIFLVSGCRCNHKAQGGSFVN